jgi:hypothetical protein
MILTQWIEYLMVLRGDKYFTEFQRRKDKEWQTQKLVWNE